MKTENKMTAKEIDNFNTVAELSGFIDGRTNLLQEMPFYPHNLDDFERLFSEIKEANNKLFKLYQIEKSNRP